jgi:hypothetical protein
MAVRFNPLKIMNSSSSNRLCSINLEQRPNHLSRPDAGDALGLATRTDTLAFAFLFRIQKKRNCCGLPGQTVIVSDL